MQITLVRHGKPASANNPIVSAPEYAQWIKRYNHSGVAENSRPVTSLSSRLSGHFIVSSDLKRAIESTYICTQASPDFIHRVFREMDIPRYPLPVKMKSWQWVYVCRAIWMLGIPGRFESYTRAKLRSVEASMLLIELAREHHKVALFGHGFLNLHIRRHLTRLGWRVAEKSNDYWGVSSLEFIPPTILTTK